VFAGNELLRRGLDTMLRQVTSVGAVTHSAIDDATDIMIIAGTAEQLTSWVALKSHAKALMLLDDGQAADLSFAATTCADGVLLLSELTVDALRNALTLVAEGQLPIPAALARRLLSQTAEPSRPKHRPVKLTNREGSTLALLAEGLSNRQIARRLGISEHGAKRLVASVLLKLDAPNRTSAVVTAIKVGLLNSPVP
jgi:two-component system nitrate/nitrite response regulator NarL